MGQKQDRTLPIFLQGDKDFSKLENIEGVYMNGIGFDINANPGTQIGTNNPTGEGQNLGVLTFTRSNIKVSGLPQRPAGFNRNISSFESVTTQEIYYFNYNDQGNHGIYVGDGNTGAWSKVVVDPELGFSDEPQNFIADHRCRLRLVRDKQGKVVEKYLVIVDGKGWQKFISVEAAKKTDGFNASLYPYWTLQPPHFDRRELLELAVRPPMYRPIVTSIPNDPNDVGSPNRMIDQSFQFSIAFQNTDARVTTLSPYSLPYNVVSEAFLNDPENLPKRAKLTLPAGSPLTEKILIYVRSCGGAWSLYDVIEKYSSCGLNAESIIGTNYWERTQGWATYNYNANLNTIEYTFDNSRISQIVSPEDTEKRRETDLAQVSIALTDMGDAIATINNRRGYNNFGCNVTGKFDVEVVEKEDTNCKVPLRTMKFYVYIGRDRGNTSGTNARNNMVNAWIPQVGYYIGEGDTQMRFGGMCYDINGFQIQSEESEHFKLDFADRDSFRLYLKGTPYYADAKWYQVKQDFTLVEVDNLLSKENQTDYSFIDNTLRQKGFFVGVFEVQVPAGRYIATLGRHNEPSTGDYRGKSTYIMGIANSRITSPCVLTFSSSNIINLNTLQPQNSLVSYSKEIEVDCTSGDIDLWGRGAEGDIFYVCCPFIGSGESIFNNNNWAFLEGYLYEERGSQVPIELFPYNLDHLPIGQNGVFTDKNGFYWGYSWAAFGVPTEATEANISFSVKANCAYPFNFVIPNNSNGQPGWKPDMIGYFSDYNGGIFGDCNRIIYNGTVKNLDGTVNYSNIALSIKDGATVYSRSDGTFRLIIHNGQNTVRASNIYVNAGGNYLITLSGCGQIPVYNFNESLAVCVNCNERIYPIPLNLNILVQGGRDTSLKENGKYDIGIAGADLAGRLTYVNVIKEVDVQSFLQRGNLRATYFRLLINGAINMLQENPDIKWISPYVSRNQAVDRYVQWVGDSLAYIDSNGQVTKDPSSAVFCSIRINSLYNYNIANNFSPLAKYQFAEGDRVRVLDNGEGQLLDTATYGTPIDIQVFGTNYNQAAINAGLLVPQENTILNPTAEQQNEDLSISLIVKYTPQLDQLIDSTGFWIEIYRPAKESEFIPFCEVAGFYPIINGEVAIFTGYTNGQPMYIYPQSIDLEFWDTYFLQRNIAIPDVGSKYFNHPFESPNVTDNWGPNCSSCGRQHVKNDNARQQWFGGEFSWSDEFVSEGVLNGLGTFRSKNKKNYGIYPYGQILSAHTKRNIISLICENDWFTVSYKQPYSSVDPNTGYLRTNTADLSEPNQKTGDIFGLKPDNTATVIVDDRHFFWYDAKNTAVIKCDYGNATDISQQDEGRGERGGVQAYINAKTEFIEKWNYGKDKKYIFDVLMGIDSERGNIYLSFRPRRNNTTDYRSFTSERRNYDLSHQETIVYNIQYRGWIGFVPFSPEGYGRLRGNDANVEMYSFALGEPYMHNNSPNNSFLNFYGVQTRASLIAIFRGDKGDEEMEKIFQNISFESNPLGWDIDMMYTDFINSFTWASQSDFNTIGNIHHAPIKQNANTYPSPNPEELFKSMVVDGMNMRGNYLIVRMVSRGDGDYTELKNIYALYTLSPNNKK